MFIYILLATGMGLCLYLFLATKKQVHSVAAQSERQSKKLQATVLHLEERICELDSKLREAQEGMALMVAPKPTPSGLNLNRRSQALRMARRGDRPDQIAAALQLPHTEVNLLLKVHRAVPETGSLKSLDHPVVEEGHDMADAAGAAR